MTDAPEDERRSSAADALMAEILKDQESRRSSSFAELRGKLASEGTESARDVLGRLDALDFVNSIVGEVTDMPDRLGDFKITGLLGRGGMGTVFEAWQESLEREVALKVLAPRLATDATMRQRFRAEARASAALHHQHIVPIYGFGEAQGFLYFAMERVNGVSLDKHIAAARLKNSVPPDPGDLARRFSGVADALSHAHRRRILHRDVKPGNILVHPDGTFALADFGLSKMLDTQSMSVTQGGGFLGTLHYTPPEQALGRDVSSASDLYSLGVTIFEALTGELPLSGKTTESMLEALLHGNPKRLCALRPDAPKDLDAVLEKLLSRDPADRYQDGEELARDLVRVADGEPVRIRRQSLMVRVWRRAKKNPALTGAAAVALVSLLALAGALTWTQIEHAKSMRFRFENELQLAMDAAQSEVGAPAGPPGLLEALTGVAAEEAPAGSTVLDHLATARSLQPGEAERAEELRDAYYQDPLPAATALIRQGRGYEAVKLLDQKIATLERSRGGQTDARRLQFYGLYVSRAIARMTASVGMAAEARIDIACAHVERPGALFPNILMAILGWSEASGAPALLADLETAIAPGGDAARKAALTLLRAFAGVHRAPDSNLMPFALSYGVRKALETHVAGVLGPARTESGFVGLERELATLAKRGLGALSDALELGKVLDDAGTILDQRLDPRSPLAAWRGVFGLLRERQTGGIAPNHDAGIAVETHLRAIRLLLELDPPRGLLDELAPRVAGLLGGLPEAGLGLEVRAIWEIRLGNGEAAHTWADRWVKERSDDPAAYLARCRADILIARHEEASLDAVLALQACADQAQVVPQLVAMFREAETQSTSVLLQQRWRTLRGEFEGT